ncbi:MAG: hypothetical protein ACR2N4_18670 [Jatrophihabitans sp.]
MPEDNSHAGQGPVMLDIGDDIGALILSMPAVLADCEVEARPIAGAAKERYDAAVQSGDAHHHHHHDTHGHDTHGHDEHGHDEHSHGAPLVHVGVLGRPVGDEIRYSAVFGELQDGEYELYLRPSGPVRLTVTVRGGEVCTADWPA